MANLKQEVVAWRNCAKPESEVRGVEREKGGFLKANAMIEEDSGARFRFRRVRAMEIAHPYST
jgi:hypothetical protein